MKHPCHMERKAISETLTETARFYDPEYTVLFETFDHGGNFGLIIMKGDKKVMSYTGSVFVEAMCEGLI